METPSFTSAYNATAAKILAAASHLFMQRGYRAVSINDIVKAAEITKPTLYYYFPDKQELFLQMGLNLLATIHDAMDHAIADVTSCEGQLMALATVLLDDRDGDMRMMRHEMEEHLSPEHQRKLNIAFQVHLFEPMRRVMQHGIDSGAQSGRSAAELALIFLGLTEAFHGFSHRHHQVHEEMHTLFFPVVFTPKTLVQLFLYGVAGNTPDSEIECSS